MKCLAKLVLAGAMALAGAGALAQTQPVAKASVVVDGHQWLQASESERRAFLAGVMNMVMAEAGYAQRLQLAPPALGKRLAASELRFSEIENHITHWYEARPEHKGRPVMQVLFRDVVRSAR